MAPGRGVFRPAGVRPRVPSIDVDEEAAKRLGALRIEDASSDEIVTELITNHEAEERTLFRAGDDT